MDYRIFPPEDNGCLADDDELYDIESEDDEAPTVTIELPTSKSILNRLLIVNAIAGNSVPQSLIESGEGSVSDDSVILAVILSQPLPRGGERVDIGAAGTAMRFLTAYYAATDGAYVVLDGIERMRNRPIADLVDTLRGLGADISYGDREGFPPLVIKGRTLKGGPVAIDGSVSSQFASALMMVSPLMTSPLTLTIGGNIASEAYLKMTTGVMAACGVEVDRDLNVFAVAPGRYTIDEAKFASVMEADWSAASYFYEAAALSATEVGIAGLSQHSLQGDRAVADIFAQLGVETRYTADGAVAGPSPEMFSTLDLDMTDTPDLVPAVAVAACMLRVPFRLSGVRNLRVKETDRIAALIAELDKFGCTLETERSDDVLVWDGKGHPVFELPVIETYGDHRIAMAFAPAALYCPGIVIKDIEVVSKSFPAYWEQLSRLGFRFADPAQPVQQQEDQQ